ncbi:NAD-dependent epimerase/dehydratase family protein [Deminuibacter soli]|uniref:NAD-dependent epimerase/dehydratase family protein n=1 Tax=Deminuibacter soli TaxID=2291815 RepID=A0A3E1NRG6_9BACT|nr:NAD-dependent epimerase/dehydratase family protein [Deminuibacter soli]RFM30515.1 NAD-dependent epimerase/dehydratase family protein [Deminuibacter soli]
MILVTGATGLVGSHLIKALTQQGKKVRAIYHSTAPAAGNDALVEWVQADILDSYSLEAAMEGVEQVYHCAAIVSFNPGDRHLIHHTNIEGTANVVNACLEKDVRKLLFVSSVAAIGRMRNSETIDETMQWNEKANNSEYGKSKYMAEMEVWRGMGEGLNAVIVNPVIILGAADWDKGSAGIFKSAYNEFPWYTEGVTGFVDVADVVRAMQLLMDSDVHNQRYILSAENITYHHLFNLIAKAFGKKMPHKKVTPLMAALVWRAEAVKGKLTGKKPLLTKETTGTAQAKVYFSNSKFLEAFPGFAYTPVEVSVQRICLELKQKYALP